MAKVRVLNKGYVEMLETMGGDYSVIRNARRCWESEEKSNPKADENLIKHLLANEHKTPFESVTFTFDVKMPIFVARQLMRHRMAGISEKSLRYCSADREYFIPEGLPAESDSLWRQYNEDSFDKYEKLVEAGFSKEQARSILPLGTYTKFYWVINGSSLMNFLTQRLDEHAQPEIREYAKIFAELARVEMPIAMKYFLGEE